MIDFKIINDASELNQEGWEISLTSKNDNKIFNEKGEEVQSTFEGRQYHLYKRGHMPSNWVTFGFILLVIFTLGTALANKYVFKSLIKGRATKYFAICVNSSTLKTQNIEIHKEKTQQILEATESKRKIGVETFSYFVGGQEIFEKLPQLDLNTLGTTKIHIGNGQYIDRPAWAPGDYPDCISIEELEKIDSDIIRGVNGFKDYEYLIVKYRDYFNSPGMFVFFCNNESGKLEGCNIHGGGDACGLDKSIYVLACEVQDQTTGSKRGLSSREKFRELFTSGVITGTKKQNTVSLRSKER